MDINTLLEKWYSDKKKVEKLNSKITKYKKAIDKLMATQKTDRIIGKIYSVSKRSNTRTYMTKSSIPINLWNQYSSRCTYDSYHLKKNR